MFPKNFTYDDLLDYLEANADYICCDGPDSLKPDDVWEYTVTRWVQTNLYWFALKHPHKNPDNVLHEWEQHMLRFYKLAKGSEKMESVYFDAINEINYIYEDVWGGYRE